MRKPFQRMAPRALPGPGESERGVGGRIGYLLRQANLVHSLQIQKALVDYTMTLPQYSVLAFVSIYPGISNADLARLSLLTPQTVNVIIKNLEKRGAISRHPHPIHGRIQENQLTQRGKTLLDNCTKHVLLIQRKLVAALSSKEEKIIRKWLVSVAMLESKI